MQEEKKKYYASVTLSFQNCKQGEVSVSYKTCCCYAVVSVQKVAFESDGSVVLQKEQVCEARH